VENFIDKLNKGLNYHKSNQLSKAYKELAVKVGNNKDYLDNINKKLLVSLKKTSLFDSQKFTKNLESTYTQILKKHEKN